MKINEILQNAYVITDGGERLDQFRRMFSATGMDPSSVKVWKACMVDGDGAMGCSVSHYSLVRHALESGLPFLVVFEDDAVPCDRAAKVLEKAISNRKTECLCLRLGWTFDSDPKAGRSMDEHRRVYGSHAYVLFGKEAYESYMAEWAKCGVADFVVSRMSGAELADESLFAQYAEKKGIHLPAGWTAAVAAESTLDAEVCGKYEAAKAEAERMRREKEVHVAYCIDIQGPGAEQFKDQLVASVASVKASMSPGDSVVVHVAYANVSVELMEKLHSMECDGFRVVSRKLAEVDMAFWQRFTLHDPKASVRPWGGIVYARLWLPRLLPDVDRCIYLDADTLVRSSLTDLYRKDLGKALLGMDMGSVPEYGYNSGVMLMDLAAIRSDGELYERLEKFLGEQARSFKCPDQTAINRFFAGRIAEIGREWNYPPSQGVSDPAMWNARIWHFYNGTQKPYRIDADDFGKALVEWNNRLRES